MILVLCLALSGVCLTRFASLSFSCKRWQACQILGDSIPIYSDKITTNARLYYNERLSRLCDCAGNT